MPLKTMGTVANPTVSVQSLMRGIELECSYRSNVPASRGLAGCFSLAMDSGSHLACCAKRHFWDQWDAAAGLCWILGIRYIASNRNKDPSALRQGYIDASHLPRNTSSSLCDVMYQPSNYHSRDTSHSFTYQNRTGRLEPGLHRWRECQPTQIQHSFDSPNRSTTYRIVGGRRNSGSETPPFLVTRRE